MSVTIGNVERGKWVTIKGDARDITICEEMLRVNTTYTTRRPPSTLHLGNELEVRLSERATQNMSAEQIQAALKQLRYHLLEAVGSRVVVRNNVSILSKG